MRTHTCKLPTKVVLFLGTLSIIGIGGIIALAALDKPIPESLSNMAIAASSALGAILAQTRPHSDTDPISVRVDNEVSNPVPVTEDK